MVRHRTCGDSDNLLVGSTGGHGGVHGLLCVQLEGLHEDL